ncbi:hypothetical protein BDM02DRAFT_3174263 [Thelephora ganbajun]|uniref:Uncharacterized protein n=1 Tax=Thelephora ganbajun TaxID=370292 RepID=A0ACB6Z4K7_THEGA|nr:hypothetical protein BDM02DRAFT_3174263 [Thelephora ganbajun]
MNGVAQAQAQRPMLPAEPTPVDASPAPSPAQKPTPGNPHPSHPHPRPNQYPTTQPPAKGGQPPANAHHPKNKKKADPAPVDPAVMYESLKNRIAALEEEETHEEEEERRFAEEAQKSVKGVPDNLVHAKYVELFAEFKRLERDHAKEKQKLTKDKDAAKGQLTKANQTKVKMENLARELQKDNKRLREDSKRLTQCVEDAQEEIIQMKNDVAKRVERAKLQDVKYRDSPDIVVKVVCKYRAELYFKISRKTKFSRLFHAWTDRMDSAMTMGVGLGAASATTVRSTGKGGRQSLSADRANGIAKPDSSRVSDTIRFIFSHGGRIIEPEQTPEEVGMETGDEILAVELMDLTEGPGTEVVDESTPDTRREKLAKNWTEDPKEAKKAMEELFDNVVRERLKDILRQYELRERHFECVIRSKELEVLLSRARAAEQQQLAEGQANRATKAEQENEQLQKDLELSQNGQTMLIDKLIACCKEPNAERTQRLFASLREELEKRGTKFATSGD